MNNSHLNGDHAFYTHLLRENLRQIFGEFDDKMLTELEEKMVWLELKGGQVLLNEGDEGDSLYFVLSGRLAATKLDVKGAAVKIGEVVRGETVGEMSMFTNEPRYATITAIRDCVLVQLSKELFVEVLGEYPEVTLNFTRLIIERFKHGNRIKHLNNSVNLCFIPVHEIDDFNAITKQVFDYVNSRTVSCFLDEKTVSEKGFKPTLEKGDNRKLIQWLNNLEAQHNYMFFKADSELNWWSQMCLRQADHIILFADATKAKGLSKLEKRISEISSINVSLVLLQPASIKMPEKTADWLENRAFVNQHFHVRKGHAEDTMRLSRIITGRANGFVLAGGGAKGFAHLGVLKALNEFEIPVDYIGGTSVGALMAASIAMSKSTKNALSYVKDAIKHKPSADISFFPLISLVKGGNIKRMVEQTIESFSGDPNLDMSDTWLPMYAVTSNLTVAEPTTFYRGPLAKILLASSAVPGVFPPVIIAGEIYVDGGSFNNFPVDVMHNLKMNKVIGVDFVIEKARKVSLTEMPSNKEVLRGKFIGGKSKTRVPSISSIILNSTLLYSNAKRKEVKGLLDLHFNPNVSKFKFTGWNDFDKIVEAGYRNAKEILGAMSKEELDSFRDVKPE